MPNILIACIGNIFLGDDGFGCEVARHLSQLEWPDNVKVVDFGIRGFDLTYALLDGHDITIFVDATHEAMLRVRFTQSSRSWMRMKTSRQVK